MEKKFEVKFKMEMMLNKEVDLIFDQSVTIDLLYDLAKLGYQITFKHNEIYICKVDDEDD